MKVLDTERRSNRISVRFRNVNIVFFLLAAAAIATVMITLLKNITDTVAMDYARLYSTNTSGALSTHLNKEIALVEKASNSAAVINWFADESDPEKKIAAYTEFIEIINVLYSDNMYLGIHNSLNEYTVEMHYTVEDIKPHAVLDPTYLVDAWYFECIASENNYVLNVDIDKILHRKHVWINYKVQRDGVPIGVICTGLEFARTAEELLSEYDNSKVRGVIIDDKGIIQMDSKSLGDSDFLLYDQQNRVEDSFTDPAFLDAIKAHLESIDGFFKSYDPIVIELSGGSYSYATIAPIKATNWSVITFYNSSSLFNMSKLMPLFAVMLIMFIIFTVVTGSMSYRMLFKPVGLLIGSLASTGEDKSGNIYGTDRPDEIGDLSRTVRDMKERLDSYNTDLEKEVGARSADLKHAYEQAREKNRIILSSIDYASKIQKSLLPSEAIFEETFSDYSIIWSPRDIVGGDIYWLKKFDEGTVLCVCDCTGHGTPGALLTMLVASTLETVIDESNYKDTSRVLWMLDRLLANVLHANRTEKPKHGAPDIREGCDIAVLYIPNKGDITVSSGNIHVFICDGKNVQKIKGQRLYVGEGNISGPEEVKTVTIPANPGNKYYIASDGLFDQIGGEHERPFGYKTFSQVIYVSHNEKQAVISEKIWEAFELYRGEQPRRDDVELIMFKLY